MAEPKLSRLEFRIMDALWTRGECSIREILEAFPAKKLPAYTTIQTTVYRLEAKNIVRRVKKVGNFHIFAAEVSREAALAEVSIHGQPIVLCHYALDVWNRSNHGSSDPYGHSHGCLLEAPGACVQSKARISDRDTVTSESWEFPPPLRGEVVP
jgi:Penicillinase repressor